MRQLAYADYLAILVYDLWRDIVGIHSVFGRWEAASALAVAFKKTHFT